TSRPQKPETRKPETRTALIWLLASAFWLLAIRRVDSVELAQQRRPLALAGEIVAAPHLLGGVLGDLGGRRHDLGAAAHGGDLHLAGALQAPVQAPGLGDRAAGDDQAVV